MTTTITAIRAREILDSRGNPTVEVEVMLAGGGFGRAAVPSGASTGTLEANEMRDDGAGTAARGCSGRWAMSTTPSPRRPGGSDATRQEDVDQMMLDLDGTPNKSHSGPTPSSASRWRWPGPPPPAVGLPLYRYLGGPAARVLPVPCLNVINGGRPRRQLDRHPGVHGGPGGRALYREALRAGVEMYHALKTVLDRARAWPPTSATREASPPIFPTTGRRWSCLSQAVETAGYRLG